MIFAIETWDEKTNVLAKVWCQEYCEKWVGTEKVDQYSNTISNFWKQQMSTKLHHGEYDCKRRLHKSAQEKQDRL